MHELHHFGAMWCDVKKINAAFAALYLVHVRGLFG